MKIFATVTSLVLLVFLNVVQISTEKQQITASVTNISSDEGKVYFALHNKTTFMLTPIQAKGAEIKDGVSTVTFEGIEPGEYAILCFHDKNNNGKMDFEPSGMPMENYGMSNNVVSYGPPTFEDGKFTVADAPVVLEIKF